MFQFMHTEGYARQSAKKVKVDKKTGKATSMPKRSVAEIIAEVLRDPGACDHVDDPQSPTFHYGDADTMRSIPARIEANCAEWKRQGHKTVRKDAQVLHTVIASYERGIGTEADYLDWERRNIAEAKRKWGDRLVAVLGHPDDEDHPHLHIYVLPKFGEDPNVKTLHAGHAAVADAVRQAAAVGKDVEPKMQGRIYKAAMRELQDEYYEHVGMYCGMTRIGPGRRRLSREGHKQTNDQARLLKGALEHVAAQQAELDALKRKMDSVIEDRAALRAAVLKREDAVKLMAKETPTLPDEPGPLQFHKMGDYVKALRAVITVQVAKLAMLPAMKEAMNLMRSEGVRMKKEKDDLVDRVATLAEHAQAWAVVQQVYPDVAKEVVRRMTKAAGQGHQVDAPGQTSQPVVPVATMTY